MGVEYLDLLVMRFKLPLHRCSCTCVKPAVCTQLYIKLYTHPYEPSQRMFISLWDFI